MLERDGRVFIAGHRGLVGSAITRRLKGAGFERLIVKPRAELDLRERPAVDAFFAEAQPEYVFLAAARVGGIRANDARPAEFIRDNLAIQTNVIDAAFRHGVRKLLFLGSSCVYPKLAEQPIREESLLTGPLEPTNEAYAVAKIAGLAMCAAYSRQYGFDAVALMPTNLYGPGDNFDLETSHVVPALMRKAHEAKMADAPAMTVWGSGRPRREFLHVDDLADAALFVMDHYSDPQPLNVGVGEDIAVADLAGLIARVVGFEGALEFDASKPDGTPRKLLDVSRLRALGWQARIPLEEGLRETYRWFVSQRPASA